VERKKIITTLDTTIVRCIGKVAQWNCLSTKASKVRKTHTGRTHHK
jgi:hypothetical protein